jgi:hypothetical protein
MSSDVLQGFARRAAREELIVLGLFVATQLALGMRKQVRAIAVEHVEQQHLGADPRFLDPRGCELRDGRMKRLAELHPIIVRRSGLT